MNAGLMNESAPLILILCTGNSCRSQMAEGVLRVALGSELQVASAGSNPAGFVEPMAIRVMREIGIDISGQRSKHFDELMHHNVETLITVCGDVHQACPMFPGQINRHHWPFPDPARAQGDAKQQIEEFRRIRDDIRRVFEAYAAGRLDALGPQAG